MHTSTWHKEWVVGFFRSLSKAESAIREALKKGITDENISIICPPRVKKETIAGIKREKRHPEWKKVAIGAAIGFLIASVGIQLLIMGGSLSTNIAMDIAGAAIRGFGGAVLGSIFGLIGSGLDMALHRFYEDEGGNSIMVSFRCDPKDLKRIALAEKIIKKAGSKPLDVPPLPPTIQRKLARGH